MLETARARTGRARFLLVAALILSPTVAHAEDAAGDVRGKQIFMTAEPPCAICHTLADADAVGEIGPNLDMLKPTEERARMAVRDGVGVMPAYRDTLSEEEIAAVSEYVARVAGKTE